MWTVTLYKIKVHLPVICMIKKFYLCNWAVQWNINMNSSSHLRRVTFLKNKYLYFTTVHCSVLTSNDSKCPSLSKKGISSSFFTAFLCGSKIITCPKSFSISHSLSLSLSLSLSISTTLPVFAASSMNLILILIRKNLLSFLRFLHWQHF